MITNNLGLPAPILEAIRNDPYDKGDCQFSATELIAPPYLKTLQRNHEGEIEVDASDRIWSLLGQSIHGILERAEMPGYTLERRYIGEFYVNPKLKVRVGAKIDVLNHEEMILDDYKVTSVYKFKTNLYGFQEVPPEYEQQINIQAECIFRETGYEVKQGRIIGILRDWRRSEAKREQGYPKQQVEVMPVKIWPHEERERFIIERIKLHLDPNPVPCSAEERWERPEKWAVMKHGQKRAVKLLDTEGEALEMAEVLGDPPSQVKPGSHYVEHRPGERTRCKDYCEVASRCSAYQEYLRSMSAMPA